MTIHIGCASWRLPKALREALAGEGTHLARYGSRLAAVEVNSSFYQRHRHSQYAKWASEVPAAFRFAVKMPRWLTHQQRLRGDEGLDDFLAEIAGLGDKLGPILIQLPPSLRFEGDNAGDFLSRLRARFDGGLVIEPRHASWFDAEPEALLERLRVSRVAADPPPVDGADEPGGWTGRIYVRLHGQPQRFYSAYSPAYLDGLAERLTAWAREAETWCIFNNTATDAGLRNALELRERSSG